MSSLKGDNHVWRSHVARARQFLADLPRMSATERSRQLAAHLGLSVRRATEVRIAAEREMVEAAEAAAPAVDCWKRHDDSLVELIERSEAIYDRSLADLQLSAAVGALRQLFILHRERALWAGARPLNPQSESAPVVAVFKFGGDDDED